MSERPRFRLIGDPHITRKFEFGVPLARRGEREKSLMSDFRQRLTQGDEKMLVIVGDLFEKPICNLVDLNQILRMILQAAKAKPDTLFVFLAGNHDISPQADCPGAFDILQLFDGLIENLLVLTRPTVISGIALFPWEWGRTAAEQVDDVAKLFFDTAIGHWDLVSYDGMHEDHLCPAARLAQLGAKEIHSGHWHIADDYVIDGVNVHCTGSMQPMTHAEDPSGKLYVTLTVEEYEDTDPLTLKDKYVRVVAENNEEVTELPDCLGFKIQRRKTDTWESDYGEVKVEHFRVSDIIDKHMKAHEVPEEVSKFIKERIDATD